MAKLSDFIPQEEIDDYLESSEDVVAAKLELAQEAVDYAQSIAPVDSGDYREGIRARRYGKTGVGIEFSDPVSNIVEYGSEHSPAFAVRARTEEHFNSGRE